MLTIAVLKEIASNECRVAATPDTVKQYTSLGIAVNIESKAGAGSGFSDEDYTSSGATIFKTAFETLENANIILKVTPPTEKIGAKLEAESYKAGSILISLLNPFDNNTLLSKLAKNRVESLSLEMMPRISRAQNMDVLSSQSNLAGYRAVVEALQLSDKVFPMMMTAAGTIKPAKVLVLGAGVAGLQAIATAKRMGAIVSAFDVRAAVKEQVESLGASFVDIPQTENAETKGGYAKEQSDADKKKQTEVLENVIAEQDVVITTALIPGRAAPELISKKMVASMKPGSVIVDLAAPNGGNCALTEPGKTVVKNGVHIVGKTDLLSNVAYNASQLFAKNMLNLIQHLYDKETKSLTIDVKDEIVAGTLITYKGKIVHPQFSEKPVKEVKKKAVPKKASTGKATKKTTKAPAKPTRKGKK